MAQQPKYTTERRRFLYKWRRHLIDYGPHVNLAHKFDGKGLLDWILEWHYWPFKKRVNALNLKRKHVKRLASLFYILSTGNVLPDTPRHPSRAVLPRKMPFKLPTAPDLKRSGQKRTCKGCARLGQR